MTISAIPLVAVAGLYLLLTILFLWGTLRVKSSLPGRNMAKGGEKPSSTCHPPPSASVHPDSTEITTAQQKRMPQETRDGVAWEPFVSVIVAARDEEDTIGRCLHSLVRQDYPGERYEVTIVDDRSSDSTAKVVGDFAKGSPNLHLFRVLSNPQKLSGKQHALNIGIKRSKGDIILITDADCVVPDTWMRRTVQSFADEVGLVAGFTLLEGRDMFARIQTVDLLYLLTIAWGATGMGRPTSLIGNNLAFRRKAYEDVGGYNGIGFTVTEDLALLEAIRDRSNWKIGFIADPSHVVTALPAKTLSEFFQQRKRWAVGGLKIQAFGLFLLITAFSLRLLTTLYLFLSPFRAGLLSFAMLGFLAAAVADILIASRGITALKRKDLLRYLPFLTPFQFFYQSIIGISVLFGNRTIQWKGRRYETDSM